MGRKQEYNKVTAFVLFYWLARIWPCMHQQNKTLLLALMPSRLHSCAALLKLIAVHQEVKLIYCISRKLFVVSKLMLNETVCVMLNIGADKGLNLLQLKLRVLLAFCYCS